MFRINVISCMVGSSLQSNAEVAGDTTEGYDFIQPRHGAVTDGSLFLLSFNAAASSGVQI